MSNTEQDRAQWREQAALARIGQLEGQLQELQLLLIRKNEALATFAETGMWIESPVRVADRPASLIWNGENDPRAFARRESDATEGDYR